MSTDSFFCGAHWMVTTLLFASYMTILFSLFSNSQQSTWLQSSVSDRSKLYDRSDVSDSECIVYDYSE